jgi:hypothetical protein
MPCNVPTGPKSCRSQALIPDFLNRKKSPAETDCQGASTRPAPRKSGPRSSFACDSCRRAKTRCEFIGFVDERKPIQCHRCKTLSISCSYETMDRSLISQQLNLQSAAEDDCDCLGVSYSLALQSISLEGSSPPCPGSSADRTMGVSKAYRPSQSAGVVSFMANRGSLDFDDAPIEAIRELLKQPPKDPTRAALVVTKGKRLLDILTEQQIQFLMEK